MKLYIYPHFGRVGLHGIEFLKFLLNLFLKSGPNESGPNMKIENDDMLYAMHMKTYKNDNHMRGPKLFKRSLCYLSWLKTLLIYLIHHKTIQNKYYTPNQY